MTATSAPHPLGPGSARPVRRSIAAARSGQVFALRVGRVSMRIDGRSVFVSAVLLPVVLFGLAWGVSVGEYPIPLADVVGEITGLGGTSSSSFIISDLRLPRVLTGVLVGAAFGVSGQIFQRMVRNPLASPDILGVSAGAAVGAVSWIVLVGGGTTGVTAAAVLGSAAAVVAIYLLAIKDGLSSYRLVLVGIGMTAMLQAVVAHLLTRADLYDAKRATVWLTGNLDGRGWEYVRPLTAVLVLLVPAALVLTRQMRALELGDETARGIGVSVKRSKLALSLVGAGLAAVATAAAGPVGFVALVAPQIARSLVGSRAAALVPAGLVGAVIVTYADIVGRRAFASIELPVGVVTAVIGAPYLLWLLARANRIGTGG